MCHSIKEVGNILKNSIYVQKAVIESLRDANQDTARRIRSLEEQFMESENYEDNNEHNFTMEQEAIDVLIHNETHGDH